MPTYTKETALYDTGAIAGGISGAAQTATSFITEITGGGIMVHPSGDANSGWRIADALQLLKSSVVAFSVALVQGMAKVVVGEANKSHAEIDYHSLQLIDKEGNTYFHVSDLRDANGYVEVTETFEADGTLNTFMLHYSVASLATTTVTVNGGSCTWQVVPVVVEDEFPVDEIEITSTLAEGDVVQVVYNTDNANIKAYTMGMRDPESEIGAFSVVEGYMDEASGILSHAESDHTSATGYGSHAEGEYTYASGRVAHAEGSSTEATGNMSHAEGNGTEATAGGSHAEGYRTEASGAFSHAEGRMGEASGMTAHAEGNGTTASGRAAHAEGNGATASQDYAHAEGSATRASGISAHAEGANTVASGDYSHAGGQRTVAASESQTAIGRYNVEDSNGTYALIIGNGTSEERSDAFKVSWSGDVHATSHAFERDTTPSETISGSGYRFKDRDNQTIGRVFPRDTTGANSVVIEATRNVDGTAKYGQLYVGVTPAGDPYYRVNGQTEFRAAIGLGRTQDSLTLSNTSAGTVTLVRNAIAATVILNGVKLSSALANGSSVQIATVPSGYRPAAAAHTLAYMNTNGFPHGVDVFVNTSGAVTVMNRSGASLATTYNIYATLTYVI